MISLTDAAALDIPLTPIDAGQIVAGTPSAGYVDLGVLGDSEYGVWEMTPGAMLDVDEEEVFVVVHGMATVELLDEGTVLNLSAGSVGRLSAGLRTIWTVTETLRKVYFTPTSPAQPGE